MSSLYPQLQHNQAHILAIAERNHAQNQRVFGLVRLGNVLAHEYPGIDSALIWNVVDRHSSDWQTALKVTLH